MVLSVDGSQLTVRDCLDVLRHSGALPAAIGTILREHIIDRALQNHPAFGSWIEDGDVPNTPVSNGSQRDQLLRQIRGELAAAEKTALQEFRNQHQAPDLEALDAVLISRGQDLASARRQLRRQLAVEVLKHQIADSRLQAYFLERAPFLERVTLSRLSVAGAAAAERLLEDLRSRPEQFAEIAWACAQHLPGGFEVSTPLWVDLPDLVRDGAASAAVGELFGPVESSAVDMLWLFRLEARWSASLEDPHIVRNLRDELFEQWIAQQLEAARIEMTLPADYEIATA